ncbi:MAG: hypothetical protein JWL77_6186 [Chthonomonadaceae bacterium]|nr:hypothetical protein [Chthonomonadaceae bacterium]
MRKPTVACASSRLCAALLLFCYSLVSIVLPFQHNHGLLEELEGLPGATKEIIGLVRAPAAPLHTRLAVAPAARPLKHCLACEWQSAQVSAALPVLRLKFVLPPAPRIPTTLPRYLSVRVISTSSRAPPAV